MIEIQWLGPLVFSRDSDLPLYRYINHSFTYTIICSLLKIKFSIILAGQEKGRKKTRGKMVSAFYIEWCWLRVGDKLLGFKQI